MTLLPRPSIHLNKSLTRLKKQFMLKHYIASFWARNLTTYRVLFSYTTWVKNSFSLRLLGQWHSSLNPQFIWVSPWLGWKAIYVETLYSEFLSAKFDNVSSTFFLYHLGQKLFLSQTTRTVTLLPRLSIHLNKSLTRLKSNLFWNTI